MESISRRELGEYLAKGFILAGAAVTVASCANIQQTLPIWLNNVSVIASSLVSIVATDPSIKPSTLIEINQDLQQMQQIVSQISTAVQNGETPQQVVAQFANSVDSVLALLPTDTTASVAVSAVLVLLAGVLKAVGVAVPVSAIRIRYPMTEAQALAVLRPYHR